MTTYNLGDLVIWCVDGDIGIIMAITHNIFKVFWINEKHSCEYSNCELKELELCYIEKIS